MNFADKQRFIALGALAAAVLTLWTFSEKVFSVLPFALAENLKSEQTTRKSNDDVLDERSVTIGVDFYSAQLRQMLTYPPQTEDPISRQQYQETLENKRRKLRGYEDKWLKIQQSK